MIEVKRVIESRERRCSDTRIKFVTNATTEKV